MGVSQAVAPPEHDFCQEMMELTNAFLLCCQQKEQLLQQEAGITSVELRALRALAERALPMRELARALELSPSRMTRVADSLEQKKLVHRKRCPEDRRLCPVALTPQGREALARGEGVLRCFQEQVKGLLKEEERALVLRVLREFIAAFRQGIEACSPGAAPAAEAEPQRDFPA